ncbi:hypothetical protein HYU17_03750 [Candidatus Woesearchaeota archaeon]|nr:hypothetical protein [Candidatus Woesearchaeota archaeon]
MDSELEELKRRRFEHLQRQAVEQQQAEAEATKQLGAIEDAVKAHLTKEALARYGTVKLAHPETATRLVVAVAQAIEAGKLRGMLGEEQLVNVLKQISMMTQRKTGRIKIVRK